MILDDLRPTHEEMVKEAILGLMARVGKVIVKNPGRAIGAGFGASDTLAGTRRLNQATTGGHNLAAEVTNRSMNTM